MIDIRKAWWAMALSAALAGCNGEPTTTDTGPAPSTAPATPAPETPPPGPDSSKVQEAQPKELPAPVTPDASKDQAPSLDTPTVKPLTPQEGSADKKDEASAKPTLGADEIAEIEKLPAAEKALALKQAVCPVSEEHLGSMGMPVKATAEGRTFLLCCKNCNAEVAKSPKEVVAKLNAK